MVYANKMKRRRPYKPIVYIDTGTLYAQAEIMNMDYVFADLKYYISIIEERFRRLLPLTQRRVCQQRAQIIEGVDDEDLPIVIVQCLGLLTTVTRRYRLLEVTAELIQNRDSFFRSIKTIVIRFKRANKASVINLMLYLIQYIIFLLDRESVAIREEAATSMVNLFNKFGNILLPQQYYLIMTRLATKLNSEDESVQSAARRIYTGLARSCTSSFYPSVVQDLVDGLEVFGDDFDIESYIVCIAAVCEETPYRFAEHFEKFFPSIYNFCVEGSDTMRECCLGAFATFAEFAPRQITDHIPKIVNIALVNLRYEPEEDVDSDEDDIITWEIRRAAARCLRTVISSHHEHLVKFYCIVAPAVIRQFREPDESLQAEAVQTYTQLVQNTKLTVSRLCYDPVVLLKMQIPVIIEDIINMIADGNIKTCQACFNLLRSICTTLPGGLTNHVDELMPIMHHSLDEDNSSRDVIAEALSFLRELMISHPAEQFHPYITSLTPLVIRSVKHDLEAHSNGLLALEQLVKIIGPLKNATDFDYEEFVDDIYDLMLLKLETLNRSYNQYCIKYQQQVIVTMGQVIASFRHNLPELPMETLSTFMQYLRNPNRCLSTVQALTNIVSSKIFIDTHLVNDIFAILCTLVPATTGKTQADAVQLLHNILKLYGCNINEHSMQLLITKLVPLFNYTNFPMVEMIISTFKTLVRCKESLLLRVVKNVFAKIMNLIKSSLMKGAILDSFSQFCECLVTCGVLDRPKFLKSLEGLIPPSGNITPSQKDTLYAAAKCTALIFTMEPKRVESEVAKLIQNTRDTTNVAKQYFNLLVIAEIGLKYEILFVRQSILKFLSAPSKEVAVAASCALGNVLQWKLNVSLPFILQAIRNRPNQTLLLHSLKAIITGASSTREGIKGLLAYMPDIWEQLLMRSAIYEGENQKILAGCFGKLALADPQQVWELKGFLTDRSPHKRALAIMAIRHTIVAQPHDIDKLLSLHLLKFLEGLRHFELNAHRAAAQLFCTVMQLKPHLIKHILNIVVPYVYSLTEENDQVTPCEDTEVRKIAFQSLLPLISSCFYKINIFTVLDLVKQGLNDHYEIQLICHTIINEMTLLCPMTIIPEIDDFLPTLYANCKMTVKRGRPRLDPAIQSDLQMSSMQTIHALGTISNPEKNTNLNKLIRFINDSDELGPIFEGIRKRIYGHYVQ